MREGAGRKGMKKTAEQRGDVVAGPDVGRAKCTALLRRGSLSRVLKGERRVRDWRERGPVFEARVDGKRVVYNLCCLWNRGTVRVEAAG